MSNSEQQRSEDVYGHNGFELHTFYGGMTEFQLVERFGIERYALYASLAESVNMPGVKYPQRIEWAIHTDCDRKEV